MPVKIQKSIPQIQPESLSIKQLNQLSTELDVESVHELFKLKPIAIQTLQNMLSSQDARVAVQAARLILEFGH